MIIISSGMPKSGSGYIYNIINDIEIEAGNSDARQIKVKYTLDHLMRGHNNNIGTLSLKKLVRLWQISLKDRTFVVKTHAPPERSSKFMSKFGMIRIVYSYRDPRDVLISAVESGKQILNRGENRIFAKMVEFDDALRKVMDWLKIWRHYNDMSGVFMLKYEDWMKEQTTILKAIEKFLDIHVDSRKRKEILWKYSRDNPKGNRTGVHFNKARVNRFKSEMTNEQIKKCQMAFGEYLMQMGYSASAE